MLTLRYYPQPQNLIPNLTWKDFIEYPGIHHYLQPALEGAIHKRLNGNPNVALGISGGIDSTTILAMIRNIYPNLKIYTFTIFFGEDTSELKEAKQVSEMYETDHKEIHIINPFKFLERQIKIVNVPKWNLYPYFLFEVSQKYSDFLVTGDGADELFGGYDWRYQDLCLKEIPTVNDYMQNHKRDWVPDQNKMFKHKFNFEKVTHEILDQYFMNRLPILGKIFLADYNGKLMYDFIHTSEAYKKHFNLQVFPIFLEPEVVYLSSHIPYYMKYDLRNNLGKIILRQLLLENQGFRSVSRGKVGWGMDIVFMWKYYVKDMTDAYFEKECLISKYINKDWFLNATQKASENDIRYVSKMFGLLATEIWLRQQEKVKEE